MHESRSKQNVSHNSNVYEMQDCYLNFAELCFDKKENQLWYHGNLMILFSAQNQLL